VEEYVGAHVDISARKRIESLHDAQRRVLEMIARGALLPDVLAAVCKAIEEQETGIICSILLLDENKCPIVASNRAILASVAIFRREPGDPGPANRNLLAVTTFASATTASASRRRCCRNSSRCSARTKGRRT
jgi:hypothetical protein